MTLAGAILLFGISCTNQLLSVDLQSAPTSSGGTSEYQTPATTTQPESSKPAPAAKHSSGGKPRPASTAKKSQPKKKVVTSNCDAAGATAAPAPNSSNPPTALQDPTNADAAAAAATEPIPPKNCPPQKIIVRQGGVSEPSIQLAGGDQASPKKDSVNQMLQSTEGNLKKISGQSLNTTQQDTVSQIRQFMDQSKEALAGGDMERAHTLAWKAQLLSEDLLKPTK